MGDLTTLSRLKTYLPVGSDSDELLSYLISAASQAIQRYTNRDLLQATYSNEMRDGNGSTRMLLRQFPAQALTLVQIDDVTIPQRTTATGSGWTFDGYRIVGLSGYTFTKGIQNVLFSYTAGWPIASMPGDIEQACVELVGLMFRNRKHLDLDSITMSAGSGHEMVSYLKTAFTPTMKAMLDQFRDLVPL